MSGQASDLWWLFTRQTVSVLAHHPIRNAVRLMARRGFRHLPVVNDQFGVVGIISAQDIIDALHFMLNSERGGSKSPESFLSILDRAVEKIMSPKPVVVNTKVNLIEAIEKMSDSNIGALPIVDENQVIQGIVTLRDLVSLMGVGTGPLGVQVRDVMTPKPVTITPDQTVMQAISVMAAKKVRRLPVSAETFPEPEGVITNKDVLRYLDSSVSYGIVKPEDMLNTPVSQVMTKGVVTISPKDDIRAAAYTMMTLSVGGLVVMEGSVTGIITERDLTHKVYRMKGSSFLRRAIRPEEDHSDKPTW